MQELRERVRQQVGAQQEAEILAAEAERLPLSDVHAPLSAVAAAAAGGAARAAAGLEGCPLHDEDHREGTVAALEVDGPVLRVDEAEVKRLEAQVADLPPVAWRRAPCG